MKQNILSRMICIGLFLAGLSVATQAWARSLIEINNDYYAQSLSDVDDVLARWRSQGSQAKAPYSSKSSSQEAVPAENPSDARRSSAGSQAPVMATGIDDIEIVLKTLQDRQDAQKQSTAAVPFSVPSTEQICLLPQSTDSRVVSGADKGLPLATQAYAAPVLIQDPLIGEDNIQKDKKIVQAKIGLTQGYRHDKLRWNIAGYPSGVPDILSELTWSEMSTYEVKGRGQLLFYDFLRLEGSYAHGWVQDGSNQDSDYDGDGRTEEFSRSNNDSSGDSTRDYSFGAGFQFPVRSDIARNIFLSDNMTVAVLGGYAQSRQNFRMTDGFQTIETPGITPPLGPFSGLDSTYKARWTGPWAGIELAGERGKWGILLRGEYHWARYYGEGNWNLRSDLAHPKSMEHVAKARGFNLALGLEYALTPSWRAKFDVDGYVMESGSGLDRRFFANGTKLDNKFNESIWQSYSIRLGATYLFP